MPRLSRQLSRHLRYRRYEFKSNPEWTSYAAQKHVCDIALDQNRNQIWLATWGGVVCLSLNDRSCIRHTSEHGLIGNAIRCIAIGDDGTVWASTQQGALCSLLPEEKMPWRTHNLWSSSVLRIVAGPEGGIYATLRETDGRGALHHITRSRDRTSMLRGGIAVKDIETLLVDKAGDIWMGNLWGLHHYRNGVEPEFFEINRARICALATGVGGCLWVGTNIGLYRFLPGVEPNYQREPQWPREQVIGLGEELSSGNLWVATTRELGRIVNNVWLPVLKSPPDRINVMQIANASDYEPQLPDARTFRAGHVWLGGASGLYEVGSDEYEAVLTPDPEDSLGNAVQCLSANHSKIWMGTARGFSSYNGKSWTHHFIAGAKVSDVRAIVAEQNGSLWIASWSKGLHYLNAGHLTTNQLLDQPLTSLAAGTDGSLWASTTDSIYWRPTPHDPWQAIIPAHKQYLSDRLIQVISYQTKGDGPTLWVGTSMGLLFYRPEPVGLWNCVEGELKQLSIQALAVDPRTNQLWVGTSGGLFSGAAWQRHTEGDVRALAFGPGPGHDLWVGTTRRLERWSRRANGDLWDAQPRAIFELGSSGLAAEKITSLAIRIDNDQHELWVGSPIGVSCYNYPA